MSSAKTVSVNAEGLAPNAGLAAVQVLALQRLLKSKYGLASPGAA
jgi:hypothetical protein